MNKVYSATSIIFSALGGGPLAAGYVLSRNFKRFGKYRQAKKAIWISLLITLALIATLIIVPSSASNVVTHYMVPVIFVITAKWVTDKYQRKDIDAHASSGGYFYSLWRVVGVALLFGIATVLIAVATYFLLDLIL